MKQNIILNNMYIYQYMSFSLKIIANAEILILEHYFNWNIRLNYMHCEVLITVWKRNSNIYFKIQFTSSKKKIKTVLLDNFSIWRHRNTFCPRTRERSIKLYLLICKRILQDSSGSLGGWKSP